MVDFDELLDLENYKNNLNLKKPGQDIDWTQDMVIEYMKCYNDPIYFTENYIKIIHLDEGLIPIELYDFQREIILSIANNRNTIVTASRQRGKSTCVCAAILHFILFNADKTVALLANKGDTAREIFSKVRLAYVNLPLWMQQGVLDWNKGSLLLENNSRVVATSTSPDAIRGYSISLLYVDECVVGSTSITVRNKITGNIEEINIEDLYDRLKGL